MKDEIKILHLSDLHFNAKDSDYLSSQNRVLNSLITKLKQCFINTESGHYSSPDYIVVTGDIANTGSESDYSLAKDFFNNLISSLKIDSKSIIAIPGNHDKVLEFSDVNLQKIIKNHFDGIAPSKEDLKIVDNYFIKNKDSNRISQQSELKSLIDKHFCNFNFFCEEMKFSRPTDIWVPMGNRFYTHGIHFKDDVAFICMNSALNSISGYEDYGRLKMHHLSTDHIINKLRDGNPQVLRIMLMHHQPNWFDWKYNFSFPNRISIFDDIADVTDILLTGHIHCNNSGKPDYLKGKVPMVYAGASITKDEHVENWFSVNILTIIPQKHCFKLQCLMKMEVKPSDVNMWREMPAESTWPLDAIKTITIKDENQRLSESILELEREREYLLSQIYPVRKKINIQ